MTTDTPSPDLADAIKERSAFVAPLRQEIGRVLIGQDHFVDRMLVCLLTGNHLLVEGLPGLAKTLAVNTLAQALTAKFGRIQFTPVQSALLEAMQEKQVTLGGETRQLPTPFLVMATQNPLDQEGTYPLPEAQMDRFMMKVVVGYPSRDEEREVLRRMSSTTVVPSASPVTDLKAVMAAREMIDEVKIDPRIEDYILDIVLATRQEGRTQLSERQAGVNLSAMDQLITAGASPRASLQLTRGARCLAFLDGRDYVLPEDVKGIAADVLRHRIIPSYEAQAENMDTDALIEQILNTLVAP